MGKRLGALRCLAALLGLVLIPLPEGRAEVPDLAAIPSGIGNPEKAMLEHQKEICDKEYDAFKTAADRLNHETAEQQTDQEISSVEHLMEAYTADANKFNASVSAAKTALRGQIDKEITETRRQLGELGFHQAISDFTWFSGQSERAKQGMVQKLVAQLADYAASKATDQLQDHFLKSLGKLSNRDVSNVADQMARQGLDNESIQQWIRAFSRNASRKDLIVDSDFTLKAIHKLSDLSEAQSGIDKQTIEGRQEAALSLVSLLVDYPGINELKAVAAGMEDVGESYATIVILGQGVDELNAATEKQLLNQIQLVRRMKELVDKRKSVNSAVSE